ncbi:MAG TPA: DUF2101 family protein [Methanobacteriales archaeon]|nr:MAG: hypothetical protein XD44_1418 [Methanobacteriaceae archaeon 41_258]MBC7089592.1 DUF2101 family protein [Methanobacteriaceae archaeon]MBC7096349.1 DUF2101 family protein [Methanobacteriales archaeon]HIH62522.1 DUF2101 family protein [Methanobacteriales archaeon]
MGFFSTLGEIVINFFYLIGTFIIELIKLPERIRAGTIRENIKEIFRKWGEIGSADVSKIKIMKKAKIKNISEDDAPIMVKGTRFHPSEKENTILRLQISAVAFITVSILYSLNLISFIIFALLGVSIIFLISYILHYQVRVMYVEDFNAYRDFFIMYIMVGFLIVLVANNPAFSTSFFFAFFPSLSILIFAVIAVVTVFLIFRVRYYRDYTLGEVIEAGKNTSYVRVDYDIRSNVKPDTYIVENNGFKVKENDIVKLAIEGSLFSARGNQPTKIIEIVSKQR